MPQRSHSPRDSFEAVYQELEALRKQVNDMHEKSFATLPLTNPDQLPKTTTVDPTKHLIDGIEQQLVLGGPKDAPSLWTFLDGKWVNTPGLLLKEAAEMGYVVPSASVGTIQLFSGTLYVPDREAELPIIAGTNIVADLSFAQPPGHFPWMGIRIHPVRGLTKTNYNHVSPWTSDPFFGGESTSGYGPALTLSPIPGIDGGIWKGMWTFSAASDSETDDVTFLVGGVTIIAQQYWRVPGKGLVAYAFYDFGDGLSDDDAHAYFANTSAGLTDNGKRTFAMSKSSKTFTLDTPVEIDGPIAESTIEPPFVGGSITAGLTDDLPDDTDLIVVVATAANDWNMEDYSARPIIYNKSRFSSTNNHVPVWAYGDTLRFVERDIGGISKPIAASGIIEGSGQTIPSGVFTAVDWNNQIQDDLRYWGNEFFMFNEIIELNGPGVFLVSASVAFGAASGGVRKVHIIKNSTEIVASETGPGSGTAGTEITATSWGDPGLYHAVVFQNSGGDLGIGAVFRVTKIR